MIETSADDHRDLVARSHGRGCMVVRRGGCCINSKSTVRFNCHCKARTVESEGIRNAQCSPVFDANSVTSIVSRETKPCEDDDVRAATAAPGRVFMHQHQATDTRSQIDHPALIYLSFVGYRIDSVRSDLLDIWVLTSSFDDSSFKKSTAAPDDQSGG
jgi:hypothetical protein